MKNGLLALLAIALIGLQFGCGDSNTAASAPEGGLAIPARNLFIVASEEDDPEATRSQIHIFEYQGR